MAAQALHTVRAPRAPSPGAPHQAVRRAGVLEQLADVLGLGAPLMRAGAHGLLQAPDRLVRLRGR